MNDISKRNAIKRIDKDGKESIYRDIAEASKSIYSKLDNWKIQLYIADAIISGKKAFKYNWVKVNK